VLVAQVVAVQVGSSAKGCQLSDSLFLCPVKLFIPPEFLNKNEKL